MVFLAPLLDPMYYAHPPSQKFLESKAVLNSELCCLFGLRESHSVNQDIELIVTLPRIAGVTIQVR
jgi:hypothetical protein